MGPSSVSYTLAARLSFAGADPTVPPLPRRRPLSAPEPAKAGLVCHSILFHFDRVTLPLALLFEVLKSRNAALSTSAGRLRHSSNTGYAEDTDRSLLE